QTVIAVENAQLYEKQVAQSRNLARRAQQLANILQLGNTLKSLDLNVVLQQTVNAVHKSMGFGLVTLSLVDDEDPSFVKVVAWAGPGEATWKELTNIRFPLARFQAAIRDEYRVGQSYFFSEQRQLTADGFPQRIGSAREGQKWRDGDQLFVPLTDSSDELLGFLSVDEPADGLRPSREEIGVLEIFANQAAIAIENARLYARTQARARQLTTLNEVSRSITSTLDLPAVLRLIIAKAMEILEVEAGSLLLADEERDELVFQIALGPVETKLADARLPLGTGIAGTVAQTGEPLIVNDVRHDPRWYTDLDMITDFATRSIICVPLISHDTVIGVVEAINKKDGTPFNDEDLNLLTSFAAQAAIAIQNARLFEAQRRRNEELEALRQASLRLTSTLELQPILEAILDHALQLVSADDAHVFLYDGQQLTFGAALWAGGGQQKPYSEPRPHGLTYMVARSGERIVVPDMSDHPLFRDRQWQGAIVGLPLRIGERVVGVMNVASQKPRDFDENELRALELLADQAAFAIENARPYQEAQKRNERLTVVNRIARAVGAVLQLDDLMETVYREIISIFRTDAFFIALYDEKSNELDFRVRVDEGNREPPEKRALGEGLTSLVVTEKKPLLVRDLSQELNHLPAPRLWGTMRPPASWLGVPMCIGERVVGVISVQAYSPNAYSEEDQLLLSTIADQVAVAVENARLYEAVRQELAERQRAEAEIRKRTAQLEALRAVELEITAQLDLDDLLRSIVSRAIELLGGNAGGLYLYRPERDVLEWAMAIGPSLAPVGSILHRGEGLSGKVWDTGKPMIVDNYQRWEGRAAIYNGYPFQAVVAAPVRWGDEFLGVLDVNADLPHTFSPDDAELLSLFATQAAIAIRNARLFETAQQELAERKRTEEALRESEEKYRNLVERANDGIVIVQDNVLKYANSRLAEITGYTVEELVGTPYANYIHPDELSKVVEHYERRMAGEEIRTIYETALQHKDGSKVEVELNAGIIMFQGRPADLVFIRDISERKRLEEQLLQAQKMEAVGRLAGGVAHDFNNLLTAIIGYSELLLMGLGPDSPWRKDIAEIKKAADRAAALTRQLLAFSRKQMLQPQVLNLSLVVAGIEKMLRRLIGEDIELVIILDPELGLVKADPGQIDQVIMNLAVNARDAMPQGGKLTIETRNVYLDEEYAQQHLEVEPGPYVMLAVSDTGVGMDEEIKSHLFEPFFTTKEVGKGTGLGLATVYGIIKQSGGHIWVYSEPGQGTTFKIYLPVVGEEVEPARLPPLLDESLHGAETILLVEDDSLVRELASRVLIQHGYLVLEAYDGEKALRICQEYRKPIHLLVTDVVMPGGMSGRQLAETLITMHPETRVLYMSGYTDDSIVYHGVLEPGTAFLQKPFTPESLARKVGEVLGGSK
ncbi:MAG: GAF domain-containing protein, partial [Anaerolineae bacterium]|nr:GAF domain-containing protein [Anaerolineae bacterium]